MHGATHASLAGAAHLQVLAYEPQPVAVLRREARRAALLREHRGPHLALGLCIIGGKPCFRLCIKLVLGIEPLRPLQPPLLRALTVCGRAVKSSLPADGCTRLRRESCGCAHRVVSGAAAADCLYRGGSLFAKLAAQPRVDGILRGPGGLDAPAVPVCRASCGLREVGRGRCRRGRAD